MISLVIKLCRFTSSVCTVYTSTTAIHGRRATFDYSCDIIKLAIGCGHTYVVCVHMYVRKQVCAARESKEGAIEIKSLISGDRSLD